MLRLSITVASNIGGTATTVGKFRPIKLDWFISLGQKGLLGTNALAYWAHSWVAKKRKRLEYSATTLSITVISIMLISITLISITLISIMLISITTLGITLRDRDTQHNDTKHNGTEYWVSLCRMSLCRGSFMPSVAHKPIMLSVFMLNVIMLNVVAPWICPPCAGTNKLTWSNICGQWKEPTPVWRPVAVK
jgi:hypothetical protein